MRRLLLVALLFTLLLTPAAAQPLDPPIILEADGDLWAWAEGTSAPIQLTDSRFNFNPSVSPDGTTLAYLAYADISVDALEREGGFGGGELPGDIWIMDIPTGDALPVVGQPENASLAVPGVPDAGIARSAPVWSPDATRLAWSELDFGTGDISVIVYDFASDSTAAIVPALPPQMSVPVPVALSWGAGGILVRSIEDFSGTEFLRLYAPDGAELGAFAVGDASRYVYTFVWLQTETGAGIGVLYNDGVWEVIDPVTGTTTLLDGTPEMVSALSPDTSLRVSLLAIGELQYTWQATYPDGSIAHQWDASFFDPATVTIAPSGQALAFNPYLRDSMVYDPDGYVWRDGIVTPIPEADPEQFGVRMIWGPTFWRVAPAGADAQVIAPATNCPGVMPSRLAVGQQAFVSDSEPNNMRSEPNTAAARIGQIPSGAFFTVLAGPVCAEGYAWWQVDYNGIVGWTVEATATEYWLEPLG